MAFGISGFSVAVDSLSAIKFAKIYPIRDENNIAIGFRIEGDFPKYGNDDEDVDAIADEMFTFIADEIEKYESKFGRMTLEWVNKNDI